LNPHSTQYHEIHAAVRGSPLGRIVRGDRIILAVSGSREAAGAIEYFVMKSLVISVARAVESSQLESNRALWMGRCPCGPRCECAPAAGRYFHKFPRVDMASAAAPWNAIEEAEFAQAHHDSFTVASRKRFAR